MKKAKTKPKAKAQAGTLAQLGYGYFEDWKTQLNRMERKLDRLLTLTQAMESDMTAMDDAVAALGTQVQANTDTEASAVIVLNKLADLIKTNANNPQVLLDLAAKLKAGADPLAAAIASDEPPA